MSDGPVLDTDIRPDSLDTDLARFSPSEKAPEVFDDTFETRQYLKEYLTDQTFQDQIDNRDRSVDFFSKIRPDLTRGQIAESLPMLYESLTGQKHVEGVGPAERLWQAADATFKQSEADFRFWMGERLSEAASSVQGLLGAASIDAFRRGDRASQTVAQAASKGVDVAKRSNEDIIRDLDLSAAKVTVKQGGPWWFSITDNAGNLGASVVQIGAGAAAGGAVGGPALAVIGAWDASSRMMAASSYRTMRAKGVDPDIADAYAMLSGYLAGGVEVTGLGAVAHIALKPLVNQALGMSMPAVARALAANAAKFGSAVAVGTGEETLQEVVSVAGENAGYAAQNQRFRSALEAARGPVEENLVALLREYSGQAAIPLDNPEAIAKRLVDTAVNSAIGLAALGGVAVPVGVVRDTKTLSRWKSEGTFETNLDKVTASAATEQKIAETPPADTKDAPEGGIPVFMVRGSSGLDDLTQGARLAASADEAEFLARNAAGGAIDRQAFLAEVDRLHPAAAPMVRAVLETGPEAAAPFMEQGTPVAAWEDSDTGFSASDLVELADSVRTGATFEGRNQLALHYGLGKSLPRPEIVEGRIDPASAVEAPSREALEKAFADGAKAVKLDGYWYVRSPESVLVVAKGESRETRAATASAGELAFEESPGHVVARGADGNEAGRLSFQLSGGRVSITSLDVPEVLRRQGVASALMDRVRAANPGQVVSLGQPGTDEGRRFQEAQRRASPAWERFGPRLSRARERGDVAAQRYYEAILDKAYAPTQAVPALTRDEIAGVLLTSTAMGPEQVAAALELADRFARAAGIPPEEFLERQLQGVKAVDVITLDGTPRPSALGMTLTLDAYTRVIELARGRAEISTVVHELTHVLRPLLSSDDQETLLRWTGEKSWTLKAEEMVARGMEARIVERKSLGKTVDLLLDKMRQWFKLVYDTAKDLVFEAEGERVVLTDEARKVFDRILAGTPPAASMEAPGTSRPVQAAAQDLGLFQEDRDLTPEMAPSDIDRRRLAAQLRFMAAGEGAQQVSLGRTPLVLRSIGAADLDLTIPHDKLKAAMMEDGTKDSVGRVGHGLSPEQITAVQESIYDPELIVGSRQDPRAVLVFTSVNDDKGRPIVAVVRRDGTVDKHRANIVLSLYGRENAKDFLQGEIDRGAVLYRKSEKDGLSERLRLQWPKRGTLPSSTTLLSREEAVKGVVRALFQEDRSLDADVMQAQLDDAKQELADLRNPETRKKREAAAGRGATPETREVLKRQFLQRERDLEAAIATDTEALRVLRESIANQKTPDEQRRIVLQDAVAQGVMVPTKDLEPYADEAWAGEELDRRAGMSDLMTESTKYGSPSEFVQAMTDEAATLSEEGAATPTEADERLWRQAYLAARMRTSAEFDRQFADGLTEASLPEVLTKLGRDPAAMVRDRLAQTVARAALRVANGGQVRPIEAQRILSTIRNNPRPYRQQLWAYSEHGERDEFLFEALAVEDYMRRAAGEFAQPDVKWVDPVIPKDLPLRLQADLIMQRRTRAGWQAAATDAQRAEQALDSAMQSLERLTARWSDENERAKAEKLAQEALLKVSDVWLKKFSQAMSGLRSRASEKAAGEAEATKRVLGALSGLTEQLKVSIRAKEAERQALRSKQEYLERMAKAITAKVPRSVHYEEAAQIDRIRMLVDPHFRRADKVRERQARAKYYRDNPDLLAKVRADERADLFARSLNLWSEAELEQVYKERLALEAKGREKMRVKLAERQDRIEALQKEVIRTVMASPEERELIRALNQTEDEAKRQQIAEDIVNRQAVRSLAQVNLGAADDTRGRGGDVKALVLTMSNLSDVLDGGQDYKGVNHRILYGQVNSAENQFLANKKRRVDAMFAWLKANDDVNKNLRHLFDRIKIDGASHVFTVDALMDIYIGLKNEKKRDALLFGNNLEASVIDFARNSPQLAWARKLGDRILAEYEGEQERLFSSIRENENINPVYEKNYSPMLRAAIDQEAMDEQIRYEQGLATAVRPAHVEHGFSIDRTDVPDEYQQPLRLGAWTTWLDQVVRQEQYMAFGPVVRDMKAVYHDRDVKSAITYLKGTGFYREIDNYVNVIANRYWGRTFTWFDKLIGTIQSNAAYTFMSYNIMTALKQIPAVFTFLGHVRPELLIKAAFMLPKVLKTANVKSRQIDNRVERLGFIAIDQGRRKTAAGRFLFEVAHVGMVPMQLVDKMVTVAGWHAAYETALSEGKTDQAAVDYADWVVDQTQQANHPKATSGAFRNPNALLRTLLMFTGPANKTFNQLVYGTYQAVQARGARGLLKSAGIVTGIGLSLLTFWIIGAGRFPEDDEDWQKALGGGAMGILPIVGPGLQAMLQGYNQGQAPGQQLLTDAWSVGTSLDKAAKAESDAARDKALKRAWQDALEAAGLAAGVPSVQPVRIYRAVAEQNGWEILGWHERKDGAK